MAKNKENKKTQLIRHFSAGGAVYRTINNQREWLLISQAPDLRSITKPTGTIRWQLPKGKIDPGEKSPDTAVREIFEETGISASVREKIGDIKYFFNQDGKKVFKVVTFYLMESDDGRDTKIDPKWKHEIAEALWTFEEEAVKRLSFKSEKQILEKGINKLVAMQ